MVVSNIQTTTSVPLDFYKYEVLRNIVNLNEAWENYTKNDALGLPVELGVIRARTQTVFNSLYGHLIRKWDAEKFKKNKKILYEDNSISISQLREIFWEFQIQLDKDKIIRMDNRFNYDSTNTEEENKIFGL